MEIKEIQVEPGGWVTIPEEARIRFKEAEDGRLEPVGLEMIRGTLSNRALQEIPFGRIESIANTPKVAQLIRERIDHSLRDSVRVDPSESATDVGSLVGWLKEIITDPPQTDGGRIIYPEKFFVFIASLYVLNVTGVGIPPEDQAKAGTWNRRQAASWRASPVKWMADELDVPVTTVRRWVRVCRDRELLPQPRHGKGG